MNRHLLHLARTDHDTLGGNLLQDLGIDMLDLDSENIALDGELADLF